MKLLGASGKIIVFIIILGLVGLMSYAIFGNRTNVKASPLIGKKAPDFNLRTFDGQELSLSDLEGNTILLNFWASWCIPCRDEAPFLERVWQQYQDRNVIFIGIAYLDTDKESLAFLEEFNVSYPNGPDIGTKIARDYRLAGVPETFFVGKSGQIVDLEIGPLTEARLIDAIESALQAD